jgi:hypothetical protein
VSAPCSRRLVGSLRRYARLERDERIIRRHLPAGWSARENVLWHIHVNGPLTAEKFRRAPAAVLHGGGIGRGAQVLFTAQDMVPFVIALICPTGLESECAKRLRADCLPSVRRVYRRG